jgi:hypothetical protein
LPHGQESRRRTNRQAAKPPSFLKRKLPRWGERPTGKSAKISSLLDTRVIYFGNNLEQLAKLPEPLWI